jgi:hypothetical protein
MELLLFGIVILTIAVCFCDKARWDSRHTKGNHLTDNCRCNEEVD